jgi:MYXO-CTERM domain-containing protein
VEFYYTKLDPNGLVDLRVFGSDEAVVFWILSRDSKGGGGGDGGSCSTDSSQSAVTYLALLSALMFFGWRMRRRAA